MCHQLGIFKGEHIRYILLLAVRILTLVLKKHGCLS